jgi:hypothetical protein
VILKADKKSHQSARHVVPSVVAQLKKGQREQLQALKGNVADLKINFDRSMDDSRIMKPLMMKSSGSVAAAA